MRSHPIDAISAALGLLAVAVGLLVAVDGVDSIDTGWWLALGALVLGLGLVPWSRSRHPVPDVGHGPGGGGQDPDVDRVDDHDDAAPDDPRTWRL